MPAHFPTRLQRQSKVGALVLLLNDGREHSGREIARALDTLNHTWYVSAVRKLLEVRGLGTIPPPRLAGQDENGNDIYLYRLYFTGCPEELTLAMEG